MDAWPAVLVVDDSRTITEIMRKLLRQIGVADIECTHDGPSALELLRTKRYGLVLSDWEMQPMDGPQLIKEMRSDPALSDIPVILVTAKYDQDHSWLAGEDAFIVKPFSVDSLREKMEGVLLRRHDQVLAAE